MRRLPTVTNEKKREPRSEAYRLRATTYRVENQAEASSAIEIPMLRPCAASHGENS